MAGLISLDILSPGHDSSQISPHSSPLAPSPNPTPQPRRIRPDPGNRGAREDRMRSGGACGGVGAGWWLEEARDGEAAAAAARTGGGVARRR